MAPETERSSKSYLWRSLAQGTEPFYFRDRVRSLLGLPDSDGVEMNPPQSLPIAGFTYVIPQFSGEFEIPDEFFDSARGPKYARQTSLSGLVATAPSIPAQEERQARGGSQPVPANQRSNATTMPRRELGVPATTSCSLSGRTAAAEMRRENSAGEDRAAKLQVSQGGRHLSQKETVIGNVLVSRTREEIIQDLRRGLLRREAPERSEPVSRGRANSKTHKGTAVPLPALATEPSPAKIPTTRATDQSSLAAPSDVNTATQRRATTGRGHAAGLEARWAREVFPQGTLVARTQSLVAKSPPQLRTEEETARLPPSFPPSPQNESRHESSDLRVFENRQQVRPDTFGAQQAPPEPAIQSPVVVVKQSSETAVAAFWERRYLSHLHLRIRR